MAIHADPNSGPASCPDTSEDDMYPQTWSLDPTRILTRREKAEYHRRGPFGTYPDDPLSVFMEKAL